MDRWDEVAGYLRSEAELDLRATGEVRPCLAGFRGDRGLALAWLRPFEKGAYHDPLLELVALFVPLGIDRLALSLGGRAWSMLDPIPPVSAAGDLRQRVLVVQQVDGHRRRAELTTHVHPFALDDDVVRWQDPIDLGPGEGWIAGLLHVAVDRRHELGGPAEEVATQAARCAELGHMLAFERETAQRLGLETSGVAGG